MGQYLLHQSLHFPSMLVDVGTNESNGVFEQVSLKVAVSGAQGDNFTASQEDIVNEMYQLSVGQDLPYILPKYQVQLFLPCMVLMNILSVAVQIKVSTKT